MLRTGWPTGSRARAVLHEQLDATSEVSKLRDELKADKKRVKTEKESKAALAHKL